MLVIDGPTITFTNIKLDGASKTYKTSIIYIVNGTVNLNSGTIVTNHIGEKTSAINTTKGTLNINGASIINNKMTGDDFGIAIRSIGGTVTMNSGTISNNTGDQAGGTIRIIGQATFTINGGTISDNTAKTAAGISVDGGKAYLYGGSITRNTSESEGGGIGVWGYSNPSSLIINGTSITNNTYYGVYLVGNGNLSYSYISGSISNNSPSNVHDGRS